MKKILAVAFLAFVLSACASQPVQPVQPQSVVQNKPVYQNDCYRKGSSYTVRKPVEVIYEDTTYTTVYEPKVYTTTKMVRKPYNNCERNNLCK